MIMAVSNEAKNTIPAISMRTIYPRSSNPVPVEKNFALIRKPTAQNADIMAGIYLIMALSLKNLPRKYVIKTNIRLAIATNV